MPTLLGCVIVRDPWRAAGFERPRGLKPTAHLRVGEQAMGTAVNFEALQRLAAVRADGLRRDLAAAERQHHDADTSKSDDRVDHDDNPGMNILLFNAKLSGRKAVSLDDKRIGFRG